MNAVCVQVFCISLYSVEYNDWQLSGESCRCTGDMNGSLTAPYSGMVRLDRTGSGFVRALYVFAAEMLDVLSCRYGLPQPRKGMATSQAAGMEMEASRQERVRELTVASRHPSQPAFDPEQIDHSTGSDLTTELALVFSKTHGINQNQRWLTRFRLHQCALYEGNSRSIFFVRCRSRCIAIPATLSSLSCSTHSAAGMQRIASICREGTLESGLMRSSAKLRLR